MSEGQTSQRPAGVKFLFWRTSRRLAVAICLALYLATLVCVYVALSGPQNNRWLYLTGLVLAVLAGQYNNAIIRADRPSG
ncbi:MAG TPA: hypothetical protein VH120_18720 [Gemmataceae bacterium]|jgi:hypothetical protein|nr:hypothetical protein [Gemmataceae bacterium]